MTTKCPIPFKVISIDVLWNIQTCPKLFWENAYSLWNIKSKSFYDEWNKNKIIKELRENHLNEKENNLCKWCDFKESYVNIYNEVLKDEFLKPSIFEIRFSNLCNFQCKMCYPNASSSIANKKNVKKYTYKWEYLIKNKTFWQDLEKILPSLKIIYIWWWEPFINPTHYYFLEKIIKMWYSKKISIIYHSNLSILPWITWIKNSNILLWKNNIIDYWKEFKNVDIFWSCDWTKDTYEKIRIGWIWKIFEKNSLILKKLWFLWWISITIQKDNIYDLLNIINWAQKHNIKVDYKFLNYPKSLSLKSLKKTQKEKAYLEYLNNKDKYLKYDNLFNDVLKMLS